MAGYKPVSHSLTAGPLLLCLSVFMVLRGSSKEELKLFELIFMCQTQSRLT